MKRWLLLVPVLLAGLAAAYAVAATGDTVATQTFTNVVTYTIPTVTVTVTTPVPPPPVPPPPPPPPSPPPPPAPPPPPPPGGCTETLDAGGDLSSFLAGLGSGDTGCLHGGSYTDGCAVSWAGSNATLTSVPGEQAILHTSLGLAGNNLVADHLHVTGIDPGCGGNMSGFTVQGANDTIQFSSVFDVTRHGILTNTSSTNVTIRGNYIDTVGSECNLDHGIYFQTSGLIVRNVITNLRCGYGIHLYMAPHDVIVAGNTVVGSQVRSGIIVNCATNCIVVNNIFASNAGAGITFRACSSGCMVDNNITWGNAVPCQEMCGQVTHNRNVDPLFIDQRFHVAAASPAVDTGRPDYAYFPDLDGIPGVLGAGVDVGAYER